MLHAPSYEHKQTNFAHALVTSFGDAYSAAARGSFAERYPHAVYMSSAFHYRQSRFNYRPRKRPQVARSPAVGPLLAESGPPSSKRRELGLAPATQVWEQAA